MSEPAGMRVGDGERTAAVEALTAHREAGRLTPTEFEERQVAASRAVTWAEIGPLFHDLPRPHPVGMPPSVASAPLPGARPWSAGDAASDAAVGLSRESTSGLSEGGMALRTRETVMALVPFLALLLFFRSGSWLWFLVIPIVGILLFGPDGGKTRRRRR